VLSLILLLALAAFAIGALVLFAVRRGRA